MAPLLAPVREGRLRVKSASRKELRDIFAHVY
jgi:hypothetical protein